jgi:hypothetical protein
MALARFFCPATRFVNQLDFTVVPHLNIHTHLPYHERRSLVDGNDTHMILCERFYHKAPSYGACYWSGSALMR